MHLLSDMAQLAETTHSPTLGRVPSRRTVAVRLEGGLGDHVLGMRVLPFVHRSFPKHQIIVYSDAAGHAGQLQVAAMSPIVASVVPVQSRPKDRTVVGRLENVRPQDLTRMFSADVFIDGWGGDMFTNAAMRLGVPVFDILASSPELTVPASAWRQADEVLSQTGGMSFVGLNVTKYGAEFLQKHGSPLIRMVNTLLERPNVVVLHMFTSHYDYAHWPEPQRTVRTELARREAAFVASMFGGNKQVVSCVDLPLDVVAALLARCAYFVGVDNGIKHLAWALGVPTTFFVEAMPKLLGMLRWLPDMHRVVQFGSPDALLDSHIAQAREHVANEAPWLPACR